MKKFAAILICISLAAHLPACTSKESREDESTPLEETAAVDSELEKVEGGDQAGLGDEANAGFVDEQLPEQALGEQALTDSAPADSTALADSAPPAESTPAIDPAPAEPAPMDSSMAASETPAGIDSGSSSAPVETPVAAADTSSEPKPKASLKKVREAPFKQGDLLLNAVYIARKGDTYKIIAMNIYGDEKQAKTLKKANPAISSPKEGDKVYYNSPNRPTDDVVMKTYYEEMGAAPEVYVAKEGDDLKKVAKEILGSKEGWKELWVTNKDLESKGSLVPGTEIKYWKNVPAGTMVAKAPTEMGAATPPAPTEPPQMAQNDMPPPPPPMDMPPPDMNPGAAQGSMAQNDLPPPPPPAEMAPPPPPPPVEAAPPPPPPQAAKPKKPEVAQEEGFSNDDMMMALGAVGVLAVAVAGLMIARKRRQQREMAAAFGDTQVGA